MTAQLKAKLEIKQTFLKSLEIERQRYLTLREKYRSTESNYSYYEARVSKCNALISDVKKTIAQIEKELETTPFKQIFSRPRLSGIEYRDNSR